jgi:hypothetical protein
MNPLTAHRDFARKARQVGVVNAIRHSLTVITRHKPPADAFDARYGTDTSGTVTVGGLGISGDLAPKVNRYSTTPCNTVFHDALKALNVDLREYSFVDVGSGKGRILLEASRYPFNSIMGIELSEKLHRIAESNIRTYRPPDMKCRRIISVCGDAMTTWLPAGKLILYMFNPFGYELMLDFILRAEFESGVQFVLYRNPVNACVWDDSRLFRRRAGGDVSVWERHCPSQSVELTPNPSK